MTTLGARRLLAVLVLVIGLTMPPPAAAATGSGSGFPARIDLPNGFFPEGIESGRGTTFFVGSLVDGAIWRGDLRTGAGAVFVPGTPGQVSLGIAYEPRRNRLWVAGGGPAFGGAGDVRVYDASSGALLATYQPPGIGLLDDIALTRDAVYVTDSFVAQLAKIELPPDGSLPSTATTLPVTGDMVQTEGFNLNGIVATHGALVVAQSSTGKLFRVDPTTGVSDEIELGGAQFGVIDGLELRGHLLYTSAREPTPVPPPTSKATQLATPPWLPCRAPTQGPAAANARGAGPWAPRPMLAPPVTS